MTGEHGHSVTREEPHSVTGAPTTVYALHGLGGSSAWFDEVRTRLPEAVRLVGIDLPGFGAEVETPGYTVHEMTEHVIARIARDGSPRWVLLGHSMGGKIAALVARRALSGEAPIFGLAGVVLLAPSPVRPEPMAPDQRAEMLGWAEVAAISLEHAAAFVADNIAEPLPADDREQAVGDVHRASPGAWRAWLETGSRVDVTDEVGALDVPAIVLAGEDDEDLGADAQPRLAAATFPRARFRRLARTGHLIAQERPAEVAAAIGDLVAEVAASAPVVPAEWSALIASPRVQPRVRATLAARALADDPAYAPRAVTPAQLDTLRVLADLVVPQPAGGRIDLAARLDAQLAARDGDGWRPADLPPDAVAARLALDAVGTEVQAGARATVEALVAGTCDPPGSALSSAQLQAWFEDARVDLVRHWLAHPASLARTGYDVFATRGGAEPLGFTVLGADLRAPWEPSALGRVPADQEGAA